MSRRARHTCRLSPIRIDPACRGGGLHRGALFAALTLRLHHWFFAVTTLALSLAAVAGAGQIGFLGGNLGLTQIPFLTDPTLIVLATVLVCAFACGARNESYQVRAFALSGHAGNRDPDDPLIRPA